MGSTGSDVGSTGCSRGYPICRPIGAQAPVLYSTSRSSPQSLYQPAPGGMGRRVE